MTSTRSTILRLVIFFLCLIRNAMGNSNTTPNPNRSISDLNPNRSISDLNPNRSISDLTRTELLAIIKQVCFNWDVDPLTLTRWDSEQELSLEQLRTVVVLLDDDMLNLLDAHRRRPGESSPYAPCNLLESLYRWTRASPDGREIQSQRVITNHQRVQIAAAYLASLSREERQRLELEEALANFRRLGVRWLEVADVEDEDLVEDVDGNLRPFEEMIIWFVTRGNTVGRQALLRYLRRMYNRVGQWGDFEVWQHLRRQDMLENPRTRAAQCKRILQGQPPVDAARERELFDQWRPQNAQAMNNMWTIFRRYVALYEIGRIEEQIYPWTDFEIWNHFRRLALLADPNLPVDTFASSRAGGPFHVMPRLPVPLPVVDEDEEQQLYNDFVQDNEEEMMDMRQRLWLNREYVQAFDLRWHGLLLVFQPVHHDI